MSKRLTLKQAQKLIADWVDNEDNDTENVEFDDSSDESEQNYSELNRDADADVCEELPSSVVDSNDDSADHTNALFTDAHEQDSNFILSKMVILGGILLNHTHKKSDQMLILFGSLLAVFLGWSHQKQLIPFSCFLMTPY